MPSRNSVTIALPRPQYERLRGVWRHTGISIRGMVEFAVDRFLNSPELGDLVRRRVPGGLEAVEPAAREPPGPAPSSPAVPPAIGGFRFEPPISGEELARRYG